MFTSFDLFVQESLALAENVAYMQMEKRQKEFKVSLTGKLFKYLSFMRMALNSLSFVFFVVYQI